jgi:predicted ribosome quality control (RQC) complex YloA/Tae2 family protein
MQELQLINLKKNCNGRIIDFQVKEKDMDDSIMYEIFCGNNYLMTLSKEGKIIFDNREKPGIDNSCIEKIIQKFKQVLNT